MKARLTAVFVFALGLSSAVFAEEPAATTEAAAFLAANASKLGGDFPIPEGVERVLVAGKTAWKDGQMTGDMAGRVCLADGKEI